MSTASETGKRTQQAWWEQLQALIRGQELLGIHFLPHWKREREVAESTVRWNVEKGRLHHWGRMKETTGEEEEEVAKDGPVALLAQRVRRTLTSSPSRRRRHAPSSSKHRFLRTFYGERERERGMPLEMECSWSEGPKSKYEWRSEVVPHLVFHHASGLNL